MKLSWKDFLHYGAALGMVVLGVLGEMGVKGIDPSTCFIAAAGLFGTGLKSGVTSGKAAIAFLVLAAATVLSIPAHAADLPGNAAPKFALPAPAPCTVTSCSGLYVGGDILESGGNFNVISTGLSGLAQNDFAMGGHVGYQFWNGQWFLAAEIGADYGLVQNGSIPGGGNSGLWDAYGLAKVGYSLAGIFGLASTTNSNGPLASIPTALAQSLMSPYVAIGDWTRPWGSGFAAGPGVQALLANNWTLGVDWLYVNYNNASVNSNVNQRTESIVRATLDYHF